MINKWDTTLGQYISNIISPDGRDTFESTTILTDKILKLANIGQSDIVLDIGCGWGNITRRCSTQTHYPVIGIEPDLYNIEEAKQLSRKCNINYIQGSFERPGFTGIADVIISSLAFHQVKYELKTSALKNVKAMLNKSGRFILCDVIILFDPEQNPTEFNRVYRYLLEKTTPSNIYKKHIAPHMQNEHIYTWNDMQKYTPKDYWFYSLSDMEKWLKTSNLKIANKLALCPFFGILTIEHALEI